MGSKMTKSIDINVLYNDLGKLLNDICGFLNDESANGYLSPNGKSKASLLIDRSKQQLQTIAIINTISDAPLESYVDMNGSKVDQLQDHQEVYSDVSLVLEENISNSSPTEDNFIICPFENTPASEIPDGKSGPLLRKEKILFFEQTKKVFVAILYPWFIIYSHEFASKPIQAVDLTRYEACSCVNNMKLPNNMKKKEESFDLIPIDGSGSKSFRFIACTPKDVLQWVSAINKSVQKRSLPPVPPIADINTHDEPLNDDSLDYEQLFLPDKRTDIQSRANIPIPSPKLSLISPLPKSSSLDSLGTEYDPVESNKNHSVNGSSNSFSTDDSDNVYDDPQNIKENTNIKNIKNITVGIEKDTNMKKEKVEVEEEEEAIYDFLQQHSVEAKDNVVTEVEQPKPVIKPKLLSFMNRKKE